VLIFAGRRHWYEGVGWDPIAFPACLAKVMGAAGIVLTNSAGGIRKTFQAGTVMVIEDHINFMGTNPLIGMSHPFWGARFPDMTCIYDQGYRRKLDEVAQAAGFPLAKGVYLAVTGPSYETPAEISAFRQMGADAVGMSTVPEAILAHAAGLKVAGLSCITNAAAGGVSILSHEEVLVGARAAIPALTRVLQEFVKKVAAQ
jgi:purine-nucleoside phosphorylase